MGHVADKVANDKILPEPEEHDHAADEHCEPHFINFSLLDTLFPNIELQTRLERSALFSKTLDIFPQSCVDRFQIGNFHKVEALECLTQVGR
jgi:hypothetical protein